MIISIHAPRTGSDDSLADSSLQVAISIHAPRTGSDRTQGTTPCRTSSFQSTLPARGATASCSAESCLPRYFNPRSPHGERLSVTSTNFTVSCISIHAPRTGSDSARQPSRCKSPDFNPRSPHGERRSECRPVHDSQTISIHAPRTGSDTGADKYIDWALISIHAPRTGSDVTHTGINRFAFQFQSTLPARGATQLLADYDRPSEFQSTLPARGATPTMKTCWRKKGDFNPRSPHGERPTANIKKELRT